MSFSRSCGAEVAIALTERDVPDYLEVDNSKLTA